MIKKVSIAVILLSLLVGVFFGVPKLYALYGLKHYQIQLKDQRGIYGEAITSQPTIQVLDAGTSTQATIYSSESGDCMDNNYTLGTNGLIDFWSRASSVDIQITGSDFQLKATSVDPTTHQIVIPVEMTEDTSTILTQGSDVASASTIELGTGTFFQVTGTTTIDRIAAADSITGRVVYLHFHGALTITNGAAKNAAGDAGIVNAQTSGDMSIVPGDVIQLIYDGDCNWHVVAIP
jgi:hypothetical protein